MTWETSQDGQLSQGFAYGKPVAVIGLDKRPKKKFRLVVSCDDPRHSAEVMDKAKEIVKGATA